MPRRAPRANASPRRLVDHQAKRASASARGYDRDWRKLRKRHLAEEPLCRHCCQEGLTVPAVEVDHIVPHRGDRALRLDPDNLQSLCRPCHRAKTRGEE